MRIPCQNSFMPGEKVVGGLRRKIELPPPEDLSEEDRKILDELQNIKL